MVSYEYQVLVRVPVRRYAYWVRQIHLGTSWIWHEYSIGYRTLPQDVEEGICQVLAHMWLESQIMSISGSNIASTSSSTSVSRSSKQGTRSPFERKLGEFFKHQIESDTSPVYGNGFRAGNQAVLKYGLRMTLDHIRLTGSFPY
ncbi:hypothetical protein HYC85_008520 [Camellia sinensis]|uniref:Protein DA1-like domain-containing protein n=1 Tax=Camellia sinensis TaxID=4442 RepID=A0A7J7HUB4_CAMSI|nr:hypothetical protein HYC85_008520 [Camellia sinensis]